MKYRVRYVKNAERMSPGAICIANTISIVRASTAGSHEMYIALYAVRIFAHRIQSKGGYLPLQWNL